MDKSLQSTLPKISIIMPLLNSAKTLEKAIHSVLNQNYPNIELILIDGGSTDETVEIIKRYESHIAYWHSKKDGCSYLANNLGIEQATGDILGFLMADDWYEPETFLKLATAYQKNPEGEIFTFGTQLVAHDHKNNKYTVKMTHAKAEDLSLSFYRICFGHTAICCRFMKRDLFNRIGNFLTFNSKMQHVFSNDKEFLLRAVLHNAKDIFIDHMGYTYLAHEGSSTFNNARLTIMKLCIEHLELATGFIQKNAEKLSLKRKWLLAYWYNDQSVRLMLYQLLERDFKGALSTAKNGITNFSVQWPLVFLYTISQIIIKRTLRLIFKGRVTRPSIN